MLKIPDKLKIASFQDVSVVSEDYDDKDTTILHYVNKFYFSSSNLIFRNQNYLIKISNYISLYRSDGF